jgi:hypothetical protein
MRAQVRRLRELVGSPSVTLQVVPPHRSALAALSGPFTLLRFAEPSLPDVVYLEQLTSALYLDKPADLVVYKKCLDRLSVNASPPRETAAILDRFLAALS